MFHLPPVWRQRFYQYNPTDLKAAGPARLFPHMGEDGMLRYVATKLRQSLAEGRVSQPLSLVLRQVETSAEELVQLWDRVTTQLAGLQVFQTDLFNVSLPPGEQFDSEYVNARAEMTRVLLAAKTAASDRSLLDGVPTSMKTLLHLVFSLAPDRVEAKPQRRRFYAKLEQHQRQSPVVGLIHEREGGLSDREFARQRLAGTNPTVIRQVRETDQGLLQRWEQQPYRLTTNQSINLSEAAAQKRLFLVEYPVLQNLTTADLQVNRYVGNPQAVFYQSGRGLYPVLIQIEAGGKVFTPDMADDWMRAKLYVQSADMTHHELIAHLCDTHLAMEAFAIATPRQLPLNHPLYQLLTPHFRFLLAINTRGNKLLLADDAAVESLLAPTREASVELINRAYRDRPFQDHNLPHNLAHRGVTADFLPEFPYRDDALLLWNAIARYVTDYLQRYYPDDVAVQQDAYLQAWAAELGAPLNSRPGGEFPATPDWLPANIAAEVGLHVDELPSYSRVPGFSKEITSLQQVIDIATQVIFTCGPQHAAVNFSQFDYAGYVPNAPLATYVRPDVSSSLDELLPSAEQDLKQMELTFALSGVRWGRLGDSSWIRFADPGDRQVLHRFQQELKEIESKIDQRNQQRLQKSGVDYPYLLPSRVPNSINI